MFPRCEEEFSLEARFFICYMTLDELFSASKESGSKRSELISNESIQTSKSFKNAWPLSRKKAFVVFVSIFPSQ